MQSQDFFPTSARTRSRRAPLVPLLLLASLWVQTALAAWWLTAHLSASEAIAYRAPAIAILLLLSVFQAKLAWKTWRLRQSLLPISGARWRMFFRWFSVGIVVCYGGSLLAGTQAGGVYLFTTALALWYTAVLLPVVGSPVQLSWVVLLLERRWLRYCGWGLYVLLMMPLCSELVLRTYEAFFTGPAGASYLVAQQKLPPGSTYKNRPVNSQGYCDEPFSTAPKPGKLRLAALGGCLVLGEGESESFLAQIENSPGDLEIYNFALPGTVPADYAGQVEREVAAYHPQLILAFLSPGNDLANASTQGVFDWQQVHTLRWGLNVLLHQRAQKLLSVNKPLTAENLLVFNQTPIGASDEFRATAEMAYRDYLQRTIGQLTVCRTPIDDRMHHRWSRLYTDLDRLIATCEKADLPLVFVLAPSAFQVNAALRDVLLRRAGYEPGDLDWELPQRRLATFAQQRQVPLIDLTPHLQLQTGTFARYEQQFSPVGHAIAADVIGHFVRTRLHPTLASTQERAGIR
jgi:hypothetical protein